MLKYSVDFSKTTVGVKSTVNNFTKTVTEVKYTEYISPKQLSRLNLLSIFHQYSCRGEIYRVYFIKTVVGIKSTEYI